MEYLGRRYRDPVKEGERIQSMLKLERKLWGEGLQHVVGVDEAGRGPLAGPVVAAAVVFPQDVYIPGVDDSKKLTHRQRAYLEKQIMEKAQAFGLGVISHEIIDEINILNAVHMAMKEAVAALAVSADHVLVDGNGVRHPPWPMTAVKGGDALCFSIAAASILAKESRDRLMMEYDVLYPAYGFAAHKGYGSAAHCRAIAEKGPCPIHRRSFRWGSETL